jgi:hypothetical protein
MWYSTPSWQSSYVSQYLNNPDVTLTSGFSRGGRGFPDISLLAYNYIIAVANNFTAVSGTSASSPVFAGLLSLVNSQRLTHGYKSVGWVNPVLYAYANSFVNDITSGDNHCVAGGTVCCSQGFSAAVGWDPVTGLGSLNFTRFLDTMMRIVTTPPTTQPTYRPGSPTPIPTKAPVNKPSLRPTAPPTMSKGYIRIKEYEEENCDATAIKVTGVISGSCLIEYDSDNNPIGSIKYTCEKGNQFFHFPGISHLLFFTSL